MIMPCDDQPEPKPQPAKPAKLSSAESLLRSIEQHLHGTRGVDKDAAYQAQQLFYDALEAETDAQERRLVEKALQLDPTNVDALLTYARNCLFTDDEYIEVIRKIVMVGETNLGPEGFKEYAGHFWGFHETRPYMRAREELAEALRVVGRVEEAVVEWEAMLKLNPNDNQGIRYHLLPGYLALGRLAAARRLMKKFAGECEYSTVFAWGKVLERFLSDDLPAAVQALAVARKQNRHTQRFIKGHTRMPKYLPGSYQLGSKDEAVCYAQVLVQAWRKHPAALQWLEQQKAV